MNLSSRPKDELADELRRAGVRLAIGPFAVRVGMDLGELVEPVRLLYGDFVEPAPDRITDFSVRIDGGTRLLPWRPRRAACRVDGRREFAAFPREQALPHLEWCLNWCIFTFPNQYLLLHSAVVERGGRAALLSGGPGAGKSTLCAGLTMRGWRLLSDEVGPFRPSRAAVLPVPRPIALKNESIEVVRALAPGCALGPSTSGTRKGTVAHLRPPFDSVARRIEEADPAWIVFPCFTTASATELVPVPRAEALLRLAANAFNYQVLGADGFETLAMVVDRSRCIELRYSDLGEALAAFEDWTGSEREHRPSCSDARSSAS